MHTKTIFVYMQMELNKVFWKEIGVWQMIQLQEEENKLLHLLG